MELFRITGNPQIAIYSYQITQDSHEARQIDLMIKKTKPPMILDTWHPYISTPFKHKPPHTPARFRPPHGRNVFYGSSTEETALYELAFHIMKLRVNKGNDTGTRTIFSVNANDETSMDVRDAFTSTTNKNDYSASYLLNHAPYTFIIYSSCRDPHHRNNAAILDIHHLEKNINWESPIHFFYDDNLQQMTWLDHALTISWQEVS